MRIGGQRAWSVRWLWQDMEEAPRNDDQEVTGRETVRLRSLGQRLLDVRPPGQELRTAMAVQRRRWGGRALAVALGLTVIVIFGAYFLRYRRKEQAILSQALPAGIKQRASGYTFTRSESGHVVFTVHAARTVAAGKSGAMELEDVSVEIFGHGGDQHDLLRAQEAQYDPLSSNFSCAGKVDIEMNAPLEGQADRIGRNGPLFLETSEVSYSEKEGVLRGNEGVQFRVGSYSGSAKGVVYDTQGQWIELERDVRLEMAAAGDSQPDWKTAAGVSIPRNPGALPPGASLLTAERLRYEKSSLKVRLWGPLSVFQASGRVTADSGTLLFTAQNHPSEVKLEGEVRGSFVAATGAGNSANARAERVTAKFGEAGQLSRLKGEGNVDVERIQEQGQGTRHPSSPASRSGRTVSTLAAQQVEIDFHGNRRQVAPSAGEATGSVRLTLDSGQTGKSSPKAGTADSSVVPAERLRTPGAVDSLATAVLRFTFRPGGRSLEQADALGSGKVAILPADPRQMGERTIEAQEFRMRFDDTSRLQALEGSGKVKVVSLPPEGTPPGIGRRETTSDHLLAILEPRSQVIRSTQQWGNFRFNDGERQANAEKADYQASDDLLTLTGSPQVWDVDSRTRADRMQLRLDSGIAEGMGHVSTTHLGGSLGSLAENGTMLGTGFGGGPGSNQAADATNVLADRVVADQRAKLAHYEGNVRAWRGSDVIESSALDHDGKRKVLSSGSGVLTVLLIASPPTRSASSVPVRASPKLGPKPDQGGFQPLTIRADHLDYFEASRKAAYRGHIQAITGDVTMRSERLDVYFTADNRAGGSRVDRVIADERVLVIEPGRRVTGDHAEYEVVIGKVIVTGGPPTAYDEERGFTTGRSLTFFIRDDRLVVDGGEKSRAISKHRIAP